MIFITWLGDAKIIVPLLALFFVLTWQKRTWPLILPLAVTLLLSDQSAYHIKHWVGRVRPSHNLPHVHLVLGAGGWLSFPSNHAANSFATATLLGFLRIPAWKWSWRLLLVLAGLVGYSRIYIGVHYPGDVLAGAILGTLIGFVVWQLYRQTIKICQRRHTPHEQ